MLKNNLNALILRAFLPARDFELSAQFYEDLGFQIEWQTDQLKGFQLGPTSFILQDFYVRELAENLMLQLWVDNLDAWWTHLQNLQLAERYEGAWVKPPRQYPWGLTEIHLSDPAGILWHITLKE
jgi:catechol 2,3-dioxygenase-like lactoylglutathione lyase family enzyme